MSMCQGRGMEGEEEPPRPPQGRPTVTGPNGRRIAAPAAVQPTHDADTLEKEKKAAAAAAAAAEEARDGERPLSELTPRLQATEKSLTTRGAAPKVREISEFLAVSAAPRPWRRVLVRLPDLFPDGGVDDAAATPKKKRKTAAWEVLAGRATEAPLITEAEMAEIVRSWEEGDDGAACLPPYIHEVSINSDSPVNLVESLQHARRATRSVGGEITWFIRSRVPAHCGRRNRMVAGEEEGTWHEEAGPKPILAADGVSVLAYKKTFSCTVNKSHQTAGTKPKRTCTGWKMIEISLDEQPADQWVLCLVYKSNRRYPEAPGPMKQMTRRDELPCPGAGDSSYMSSPPWPLRKGKEAAATTASGLNLIQKARETGTKLLVEAAKKAASDRDLDKACEIYEFVVAKRLYLRTIDVLGLDCSIVSDSFAKLEVHLQYIAATKKLSPTARKDLVSLGQHMCTAILSGYLNESEKKARQESNDALERTGVDAQQASRSGSKDQVVDLPLAVQDIGSEADAEHCTAIPGPDEDVEGADNELATPVNRDVDGDHAEAPPGAHQVRTDTGTTIALEEINPLLMSDDEEDTPLTVDGVKLNEYYRTMGDIVQIKPNDGDRFTVSAPQGDSYTMPVSVPKGGVPAGFTSLVGVDQGYSAGFPYMPLDPADYGYLEQQGAEAEMVEASSGPCRFHEDPLALMDSAHRPSFDNSAEDSMPVDGFDDGRTYVDLLDLDQDDHTEGEAEQQAAEAEVVTGLVPGEVDQSRPMDEFNHGGLFDLGFLNQLQDEHNDGAIDPYFFNLLQDDQTEAEARSRLAGIW